MPDSDMGSSVPAFASGTAETRTAADVLGIDASFQWASAIEGIRKYFAGQPPEKLALDDDYVYVRAPMPDGSGFPWVMIGLEADDGRIESVRFALPDKFDSNPPAGLEGYVWKGGPTEGWWVLTVDPRTGNSVGFDD